MAFCDRIKEARTVAGMTQLQLAEVLGVAKSTISSYENGDRDPPPNMIFKLINALGIDANYLFQDEANNIDQEMSQSPDEKPLIKKYRQLDIHGKRMVNVVLDEEYSRCTAEKEDGKVVELTLESESGRLVARNGRDLTPDDQEEILSITRRWRREKDNSSV